MTELGEKAIKIAIQSGTWDAPKSNPITDEQVEAFAKKLVGISPAYENFNMMSRSVRFTYTRRFLSFKTEEARQKTLKKLLKDLTRI